MLFPAPAAEAVTVSFRKEHGAIYERFPCVLKSELEPEDFHFRVSVTFTTMFPFCRGENHVRGCGSSTDLEVKDSSGRSVATCRLLKSLSVFLVVHVDIGNSNKLTFCLVQSARDFLHGFCHPVRYFIGLLPLAILRQT